MLHSTEPSVILATVKYILFVLTNVCKSIYDVYYLNYKCYIIFIYVIEML